MEMRDGRKAIINEMSKERKNMEKHVERWKERGQSCSALNVCVHSSLSVPFC